MRTHRGEVGNHDVAFHGIKARLPNEVIWPLLLAIKGQPYLLLHCCLDQHIIDSGNNLKLYIEKD
jgi:hypothetical protein